MHAAVGRAMTLARQQSFEKVLEKGWWGAMSCPPFLQRDTAKLSEPTTRLSSSNRKGTAPHSLRSHTSASCPIASLISRFLVWKMKSEDVDFFLLYVKGFFIAKETTDMAAP